MKIRSSKSKELSQIFNSYQECLRYYMYGSKTQIVAPGYNWKLLIRSSAAARLQDRKNIHLDGSGSPSRLRVKFPDFAIFSWYVNI